MNNGDWSSKNMRILLHKHSWLLDCYHCRDCIRKNKGKPPAKVRIYDLIWYDMIWYDMISYDISYAYVYIILYYIIWYRIIKYFILHVIYYILYIITYYILHLYVYMYMSHNWLWVLRHGIENERHVSPPDMVIFADQNQVAYPLVICYIAMLKMAPL